MNKDFWERHLNTKSRSELEVNLRDFDQFISEMESELRIVLSPNRAEICREVLLELYKLANQPGKNARQGELFTSD